MENVVEMYTDKKMSIKQIARVIGQPYNRTRSLLLGLGVHMRTRNEGIRLIAKERGLRRRGEKTGPRTEEQKQRMSEAQFARWKGKSKGTRITQSGYYEFTTGENKGRLVHDVIIEAETLQRIPNGYVVHHIDGCVSNNDRHNLALMTRSAHSRLHRLQDQENGIPRKRMENGRFS